jgi:hypothetical protein
MTNKNNFSKIMMNKTIYKSCNKLFLVAIILIFALQQSIAQDQLIAEYNFEEDGQGWSHRAYNDIGTPMTDPTGGWIPTVNWANGGTAGSYRHNNAPNSPGVWFMFSPNMVLEEGEQYYVKFGATLAGANTPTLNSRVQVRWRQTSLEPPYLLPNFTILMGSTYLSTAGGVNGYVEFTSPVLTAPASGDYRFGIGDFFNANAWACYYDGIRIFKVGQAVETCEFSISPAAPVICEGESVTLTAGGDATSYTWSASPDLSTTSGATVVSTPQATTTYTITGTNGACTSTQNVVVTVNPNPVLTTTPASPSICVGENVSISAGGAESYSWSPSTGLSSTAGATVIANPSATTTYTLIGTSNECNSSLEVVVEVNEIAQININPSSATICLGDTLNFEIIGTNNISWNPLNNIIPVSQNNYKAFPTSSTDFTITDSSNECLTDATLSITVEETPVAEFSYQQTGVSTIQFTNQSTSGNSYSWNFGGGNANSQQSPAFTFPFEGMYPVTLIAQNPCGSDTLTKMVEVLKLSVNSLAENNIQIFPNPATETLFIQLNNQRFESIHIINSLGQTVKESLMNISDDIVFDISHLSPGIYFVQLINNKKLFSHKLIIQ